MGADSAWWVLAGLLGVERAPSEPWVLRLGTGGWTAGGMGTSGLCESRWGSEPSGSLGGQGRDLRQGAAPKRPEQLLFSGENISFT